MSAVLPLEILRQQNVVSVNVVNKQTQTPGDKQVTFSKVNLAGEPVSDSDFQGRGSSGQSCIWPSEADKSGETLNLEPGIYTSMRKWLRQVSYLAVTIFQVNEDGTVTVLDANSNAVEYMDE